MPPVCLYFQVHQPWRLRPYNYFQVGRDHRYFDETRNAALLRRVAEKCYRPATAMFLELLGAHSGFSAAFSISGTLLQQLRAFAPDALESFRGLVATGRVELLAETSHHSLAFLASPEEFREQVALHRRLVAVELGADPRVFRNTELIYSDGLAAAAEEMGFSGVLADGVEELLGGRSPHHLYRAATPGGLSLLLRDYRLSDDIAFRFSNRAWTEYPLSPARYARWVAGVPGELVCLFMDLETFGEHHARETGIFESFADGSRRTSLPAANSSRRPKRSGAFRCATCSPRVAPFPGPTRRGTSRPGRATTSSAMPCAASTRSNRRSGRPDPPSSSRTSAVFPRRITSITWRPKRPRTATSTPTSPRTTPRTTPT
ncbi:MAG: glycoside hydrolase family 57 protein [Thermoanaerobaculia bacterium]